MNLAPASRPARDAEAQDGSGPPRVEAAGQFVVGVVRHGRVLHPANRVVGGQRLGHCLGVGHVALHPQRQRLDALEDLEGVGRAHASPEIAQTLGPSPAYEGAGAELVTEADAVIAGVGLRQRGKQARGVPVEVAAVNEHASESHAVPAQELGGRVHHDVGAVLEGLDEVRRREGGVHHQGQAAGVGHGGHRFDVEDLYAGIAERLREDEPGVGADGGREVVGAAGVHEGRRDAEAAQREVEHVVGAAVDVAAGHDVGARAHEGGHGQEERGLAAGGGHRPHSPLEGCDTLLEHGHRGVGDPRVDVAGYLEVEQPGRVVGVLEGVRGGEVDGHRPGACGRVAVLARVKAQGVESQEVGLNHWRHPTPPAGPARDGNCGLATTR